MLKTFGSYSEALEAALSSISDRQKFFFGVWCCHHLYEKYAQHIPKTLSAEESEKIKEVMEFLWHTVDSFDTFSSDDAVYDYVEALREIDPQEEILLPYDTIEGGITNLLGSLEDVTSFILQRDDEVVASASENIVNVLYLIMTNEQGLDDSVDPDEHFEQPLVQEELSRQFRLLEQLKNGAQYTSKYKQILR